MFRKRDEIDSTSRYHPLPRGGCRLGFGRHLKLWEEIQKFVLSKISNFIA